MNYTSDSLKKDNHYYINGFIQSGENVTLIDTDYEKSIKSILKKMMI